MSDNYEIICPICNLAILPKNSAKICPTCGVSHHEACWVGNNGCSNPNCNDQCVERLSDTTQTQSQSTTTNISQDHTQQQPSHPDANSKEATVAKNANSLPLIFAVIGLLLIIIGLIYPVPSREFSFREIREYVGGDAYNATIEAAIRGGEIAGTQAAKAIQVCGGFILMALSTFQMNYISMMKSKDT